MSVWTPGQRAAMTRRIVKAYRAATPAERAEGERWYIDAWDLAAFLDPRDADRGAGVIAALSPRLVWAANVKAARAAYAGQPIPTLRPNAEKARRILAGEDPSDVLGGRKVRAFWECIVTAGRTTAVCVDMHALDIALGFIGDDTSRAVLARAGAYDEVAACYRAACDIITRTDGLERGVLTAPVVQAVTWTHHRASGPAAAHRSNIRKAA